MDRKAVRSTNIVSIGYDARSKTLEIEFRSGGIYQYTGVPEKRYQDLIKAKSIASYFQQSIRNWYAYTKVN